MNRRNRPVLYRRAIYLILLLVLHLLQSTAGLFPSPFGAHALLLIPAVVCIGMCEREYSGLFFGLFAGLLWDSTLLADHYHAMFLCVLGLVCGALAQHLMRNNIMTAALLSGFSLLLYALIRWASLLITAGFGFAARKLLTFYLPCVIYTLFLSPILYLFIRFLSHQFQSAQSELELE